LQEKFNRHRKFCDNVADNSNCTAAFKAAAGFGDVEIIRDLSGIERVVAARI